MIPIKLTLHNFIPYRDIQTLDFSGIHTASICGDNGSGKSSIIDAITWALWGESRAKKDDDLIHQGQQETEVDFEFAIGEQKYRAVRKHSRPKRRNASGQTILHLFIAGDGGWRSIDGDNMTMTEQKISAILHMDYDTFINSAYLRQGHADEFTTAVPAERKKVLGSILELGYYDELSERAREFSRQRLNEKEQLTRSLSEIDAELAGLPQCQSELLTAQSEVDRAEEALRAQDTLVTGLRQQKDRLEARQAQLAQVESSISQRNRTLKQVEDQLTQVQTRITEHEAVLSRREEIEMGYTKFTEARDRNESMNKDLAVLTRLSQKKHEIEMTVARLGQELSREHARAQSRLTELEKLAASLGQLKDDTSAVRQHFLKLAAKEDVLARKKQSAQESLAQIRNLESDRKRLEREIEEIGEKLRLLKTEKGAKCPLCGCALGEDGLQHIESEFTAQRQVKADAVKSIQAETQAKHIEQKQLAEEAGVEERELARERAGLQGRLAVLEKEISRAEEAAGAAGKERENVCLLEEQLATRSFATAEMDKLQQVDNAIARLDYDAVKHEALRKEAEANKKYESPKQKLDEADRLIDQEKGSAARMGRMAEEMRTGLQSDIKSRDELAAELKELPALSEQLSRAESELQSLTARQKRLQERLGTIKGRLEYLRNLGTKRKEQEELFNRATKEEQIYRELVEAFGKKGVQSLIIETALPEIENEANRLLARMTDNRMSVKIESQRETLKGDTVETLDIKIADELGTRNYELFSGGEAFRINIAIRIALSRLLANRHGTPLRTLIIDEGFGTQDAVGIEKLREAITTIQDDFEKILVITHIEELRDAFPARIDVVKEADGSKISLN